MKLTIAKTAGFCMGVRRAVDLALEAANKEDGPVYTYGPLIHNPQVVEQLRKVGVTVKGGIADIAGGTVIFRSHGVPFHLAERAREKGLRIVDATCPFVKRAQKFARSLSRKGYLVIIVGDKSHPEVKGLKSYVEGDTLVVGAPKELAHWAGGKKVGVVACNSCARACETGGKDAMNKLVERLRSDGFEVEGEHVVPMACNVDLAKKPDYQADVLVMLGCDSALNTFKELFPKKKMISGLITVGIGARDSKSGLFIMKSFVEK